MKEYSCPDCSINTNSCDGCPRVNSYTTTTTTTNIDIDWSGFKIHSTGGFHNIPDPCKGCLNHPSNGGDGICWCVLGSYHITY